MTLKTFQTIENNISKLMEGEACNIQLINEICLDYKWFVTDSSVSLFTFHLFNVFKRNLLQHLPTLPRRSMCGVSQKSANKKKLHSPGKQELETNLNGQESQLKRPTLLNCKCFWSG